MCAILLSDTCSFDDADSHGCESWSFSGGVSDCLRDVVIESLADCASASAEEGVKSKSRM